MSEDPERLALELERYPSYRVQRRVDSNYAGGPALQGIVRRAAILDVETTGMDPAADRIIELGVVVFEYGSESGQVGPVVGRYNSLEDPGRPIPPEVTAIHHITDDMVRGRMIDDGEVSALLHGVGLVIAHNAKFDRPFVEARLPALAALPWACSIEDVGWKTHGFASSALEFLAFRVGLFYGAHRAEVDCMVVLAVLAQQLAETGGTALRALLENARKPSLRITALASPYEVKDLLKARAYRWDGERKVWTIEVRDDGREAELAWLKVSIYEGNGAAVEVETLTARQRYSRRPGNVEKVQL